MSLHYSAINETSIPLTSPKAQEMLRRRDGKTARKSQMSEMANEKYCLLYMTRQLHLKTLNNCGCLDEIVQDQANSYSA